MARRPENTESYLLSTMEPTEPLAALLEVERTSRRAARISLYASSACTAYLLALAPFGVVPPAEVFPYGVLPLSAVWTASLAATAGRGSVKRAAKKILRRSA